MKRLFIIILCVFLTGCLGIEERREKEDKAKEMAQEYFYHKYGEHLSDDDIIRTNNETVFVGGGINKPTASYVVYFSHNNEEYKIYVNIDNAIDECFESACNDNYERKIITEDLIKIFSDKTNIPNEKISAFADNEFFYLNRRYTNFQDLYNTFVGKSEGKYKLHKIGIMYNGIVEEDIIKEFVNEYSVLNFYFYKINDEQIIDRKVTVPSDGKYNLNNFSNMDMDLVAFQNISDYYLEEKFVCEKECNITKYKTIDIGNSVFIKFDSDNEVNVENLNISDYKNINEKINSCNNTIIKLYRVFVKNSFSNVKVYSKNNGFYQLYGSDSDYSSEGQNYFSCNYNNYQEKGFYSNIGLSNNSIIAIVQ